MSNRNSITCGSETCISAMLIQLDLNKCWLTLLEKIDKLYINTTSTRILQRYKKDYIENNNQTNSKKSHIHLRACDAASSYHCPSPIVGSKIPKWDCILNCC